MTAGAERGSPRWALVGDTNGTGQSFSIVNERTRIGRAAENDLVLHDDLISRHHCQLVRTPDGRLMLEDLGSTHGTFVNDQRLTVPTPLQVNDLVRIGRITLRVHLDTATMQPAPANGSAGARRSAARGDAPRDHLAWLVVPSGERRYLDDESLIGRGAQNDVRVTDGTVSRYHAIIRQVDGQWVLSDLGSGNGTFVNDRALFAPQVLRSGDHVRFARAEFVFQSADGERDGAPTPVGVPTLVTRQTPHFHLHYATGSFAASQIAEVSDRLEGAYGVIAELLGLAGRDSRPIDVFFSDVVENPQQPGTPLASGGYARPECQAIYEVFRADAPGKDLERSLLLLLLANFMGDPAGAWPPMLLDGLRAYVLQRLGKLPPATEVLPLLAEAQAHRALPPIDRVLASPHPVDEDIVYPATASFIDFLTTTRGAERFQAFLRQTHVEGVEGAAWAAFGQPLPALDKEWRKGLKVAQPGGIGRFLKLSLRYLRPYWLKVVEITVYLALSVAFGIGMAKMQGLLLDKALIPGDRRALTTIMGILVAAFVVVSIASLRENYLKAWVSESVLRELRQRLFSRLQHLHPGFFQRMQTGDIMSRMTSDLAAIEFALTSALAEGLRMLLTLVVAMVTIFLTDWKLAAIAMVGTPLFFLTSRYLGPAAARASAERQKNLASVSSELQENLGAQSVVKAFGLQERMIQQFRDGLDALFRASLRLTFLSGIFGLSASSVASAIQLTVLGIGAWLVIGGSLTAGTLFAFLALMAQIIGPLQSISGLLQALQQASGALDRVEELLGAEPAIQDGPQARPLGRLAEAIRLEDVTFGYDETKPTLHGLTLTIPAGANVALVGPSGCGKSTTLNLLMRFYDPGRGRVTFDGVDLREAALESVRGQMGVVFQESVLFNTSIRENIRLGNPLATDAEVEAAARAAEIHDLIASMPEGYDTVVGERGGRLSGGQRQRVAIARAIIRNPAILLLDEATSALDPRTEAAINETLRRLARGRTTISVTHRLASVVHADQVYVFEAGQLVEQGTHDELVRRGGLYARLWQEQSGAIASADVRQVAVEAARLQAVPLFATLEPDLLATLAQRLSVERYETGDLVMSAGDLGDKLYLVGRGEVEVLAADPARGQQPLAVLHDGDYFGELALLYDLPRTATVRARTPAQLYSLSKDDFHALLLAVPTLRDTLEQTIAMRQGAQLVAAR